MKRLITTLIILIALTSSVTSQTVSDSTKIPNPQLKKAINIIERGKVVNKELNLVNAKLTLIDSLILLKDSTIAEYQKKDSTNSLKSKAYEEVVKNYKKTISNQEMQYNLLGMKITRLQIKKWVLLFLGLAGGFVFGKVF